MKKIIYTLAIFCSLIITVSCNDDFLERFPETSITADNFFKSAADLETYSNGFYENYEAKYEDLFSDNISLYTGTSQVDNMLRGKISPQTVSGWDDWGKLRRINFMMDNQ